MSFFTNIIGGAAQGFLMSGGNPFGAVAGALGGGALGTGTSVTGGAANAALGTAEDAYLAGTAMQQIQQMAFQYQLQQQSNQFNDMTAEKSEMMRESNELRTVAMEQRKADIEITKEFIKSIV
ncbi:MAG: hypothetical protein ABR591_13995 [Candidatus Velthaea sp.]